MPGLASKGPPCGCGCLRTAPLPPHCSWWASGPPTPHCSWCLCVADSLGGGSEGPCFCPTPCNLTRYGKEISMVRIPNRGSARYLARKYNRNETYIRYVCACVRVCECVCVRVCVVKATLKRPGAWWRRGVGCIFVNNESSARNAFHNPFLTHSPSHILCLHLQGSPCWSKCLSPELPRHPVHISVIACTHCVRTLCLRVFLPQQPGSC